MSSRCCVEKIVLNKLSLIELPFFLSVLTPLMVSYTFLIAKMVKKSCMVGKHMFEYFV